jgi:predicted Zn-dependent peptidase
MKFTKKVLENGLRIITIPMAENPAVTVLVMVEAGAKYEAKEENGISHFLEHMVFKGTPRRPHATDISREFDGLGAESNAFTGEEYTGYYAKVGKKHLDQALDIISDMYLNPLFPEEEIVKEKGVIIEEIRMYRDRPDSQVQDALGELMYGDQPAGWTVLGPEENIRSFNRAHFTNYRNRHYVASATTVVVAGGMHEKEVEEKVTRLFAPISTGVKQGKLEVKENQVAPQSKVVYKDTGQTHLAIGFRTFSIFDERKEAMRVLAAILGGGMSSRLFAKMRNVLGICYYVRARHTALTDHGLLTVSAGVDTSRVELGIQTILEEVQRLVTEPVSPAELQKAKDYISGHMLLNLETSDAQAEYAAHQEILKREITTPDDSIRKIQNVTAEEIQALAREFLVEKGLNLAIIGPYKDPHQFDKLLTFSGK